MAYWLLKSEPDAFSIDDLQRLQPYPFEKLRALIADGIADGSIAPVDVKMSAFAIAGALNWPARWHDPNGPSSAEEIAAALVDTLIAGLAPRPCAPIRG